jgi:hypothetical protein
MSERPSKTTTPTRRVAAAPAETTRQDGLREQARREIPALRK